MTKKPTRIAIIEDNQDLREEMIFFLQTKGHTVWGVNSAEAFWKQLHHQPVDIILVDIGLPGEDGFSVVDYLRKLKEYGVIVISARGSQQDKLLGLSLGADAYLIKPINFADLADTISTLWQRLQASRVSQSTIPSTTSSGATRWTLVKNDLCSPEGERLPLTPKEYALLDILLRHANEVLSKEQLCHLLFGYETNPDIHRIDVTLSRLRIKAQPLNSRLPIRTIFGKGIVFFD